MPVDFAKHAQAFSDTFGETDAAQYTHGSDATVDVTFVRAELRLAFPEPVGNAFEAIWIRTADLGFTPVRGDSVLIDSRTYHVLGVRSDRSGGSYLALG